MREQVIKITSDLTGTVYEGTDVPTVKVTVNGKSGTRDLTPDESAALAAWVSADAESLPAAREALRALMAPADGNAAPAKRKSGSKSGSGNKSADPRNAAIREWVNTPEGRKALGFGANDEISARGRMPGAWADAYDAAHASKPAPAAAA